MNYPYLSVVTVSRNDDHGGDPLRRTQLFINSLSWQAEHYTLLTELVLVDWNPPEGKPGLADVLRFPAGVYFSAKVIVVPPALHIGYRHGDRQPLFQMIGKNVGIHRARGEFILATNIDILLDDSLFARIARKDLDAAKMYRADRYDILNTLLDEDHGAQQDFCREFSNQVRRNHRVHPQRYCALQEKDPRNSGQLLVKKDAFPWAEFSAEEVVTKADAPLEYLHTNACGDFTLLHRDAWAALRGYGEFEAYSMHIDSVGCVQSHLAGYREACLLPPLVCYHIEHAPGSGWTPEAGQIVFERICKAGIPFLSWNVMNKTLFVSMQQDTHLLLNDERWGLRDFALETIEFNESGKTQTPPVLPDTDYRPLAAIKQQYELGMLFQSYYYRKDGYINRLEQEELFNRIVKWKLVLLALWGYRTARRCYWWLRRIFKIKKAFENQ